MIVMGAGDGLNVSIGGGDVRVEPATYKATGFPSASVTFNSNGVATGGPTTVTGPTTYNWLINGNAADFEIYCRVNSGSVTGAAVNKWLNLGTTRKWQAIFPSSSARVTITIRHAASGTELDSAVIELNGI